MSQDVEDVPLLVPEDLPAGWEMPDPPVIASCRRLGRHRRGAQVRQADIPHAGAGRGTDPATTTAATGVGSSSSTSQSHTRVLLRLQRQYVMMQEPKGEVRITGIVYLPEQAGDPVASPMLRNLPTSRIEAAINRRQFTVTGATRFEGGTLTMPSGRILRSRR